MGEGLALVFSDAWLWLFFISLGLLLIILELILGVDTGLDMAFVGSAFVLGGLITWPFYNWIATLALGCVFCIAYLAIGRHYVHRWRQGKKSATNIDTIIGKTGVVTKEIAGTRDGRVRVGNEDWKGRSADNIKEGEEIVVTGVSGVTLTVEKSKGGE